MVCCSQIAASHREALRQLRRIYTLVQHNESLQGLLNSTFDSDPVTDDEAVFLEKNHVEK